MLKFWHLKLSALIILLSLVRPAVALVPLESLLLGDFSDYYTSKMAEIDPISYIFQDTPFGEISDKSRLAVYRGFIFEGMNLKNRCSSIKKISYATNWSETQAKRSFLATTQYIGLDVTTRALAKYAQKIEYSEEEYQNLIDNLVGNYCSTNLSIISIRQLKKNMMALFKGDAGGFNLPSVEGNSLFPQSILSLSLRDKVIEQEFDQTAKLFRAFCSWGGDVDDLRLLVPLVKNPVITSFIARNMGNLTLKWIAMDNTVYKAPIDNSINVLCDNLICRRTDNTDFMRKFPRSMGYKSIDDDVERAYCSFYQNSDYRSNDLVPKIKSIIADLTEVDDALLASQFIALITGIPDFMIGLEKWKDAHAIIRSSMDLEWDKWADERNAKFSRDLFFEEQLTIEKIDRKLYFNPKKPIFSAMFDVNLGEYDRINQSLGKIDADFKLSVSHSFLAAIRRDWGSRSPRDRQAQERIITRFKDYIEKDVEKINSMFAFPLWKGDFSRLVALEILDQLTIYQGNFFQFSTMDKVDISVTLSFAPFALKYQNYKYKIMDSERRSKAHDTSLMLSAD